MAENTKLSGWPAIINAVQTPLGFFTVVALILDAVLLGASLATARVTMWAPIVLLGLLIVGVFVIAWFRPLALYHPRDWPKKGKGVTVKLLFFDEEVKTPNPIEPINVDLDVQQCGLMIKDERGRRKSKATPNLIWSQGGWTLRLPEDIVDTDGVYLELVERSGRVWEPKPFTPYETQVRIW
jgi:hypothetical protein